MKKIQHTFVNVGLYQSQITTCNTDFMNCHKPFQAFCYWNFLGQHYKHSYAGEMTFCEKTIKLDNVHNTNRFFLFLFKVTHYASFSLQ